MKPQTTRQEIILISHSSLGKLSFCRIKDEQAARLSITEKLEQACWDGLLPNLLPGIVDADCLVWKIETAEKFICISLGPDPGSIPLEITIDPFSIIRQSPLN